MNSHADLKDALKAKMQPKTSIVEPAKPPFLAVCMPAMDFIHTSLLTDMIRLMHHSMSTCAGFHPIVVRDTILQRSRTVLANAALENERVSHVLFVDTDMHFPPDVAERLIKHDKDIIGVNYRHRRPGVDSTARGLDDQWVDSGSREGIEQVLHTGTGMLLVKRQVFEKLPKPWFETTYREKHDDWMGEDVFFCTMARVHGFDIWVDHDLSKEVTHIGQFEYGWT